MMNEHAKPALKGGSQKPEVVSSDPTRERLVEAAGRVFAERGYYSTTVRQICRKAGVNVAAVNYHFGDKLGLYTEVLERSVRAAQIEAVRNALDQNAPPEDILRTVIRTRLRGVCRGDLPDWHFRLMVHELAQPTPALTRLMKKVSRPIYARLLDLIGKLIALPPTDQETRLCANSIMGQIFLYVLGGPLLARVWPELKMTSEQVERIADHIADFSLAYLREAGSKALSSHPAETARR
jgi:AcrR family transcriptional regulator